MDRNRRNWLRLFGLWLLLAIVSSAAAQEHFQFSPTSEDMSVLIVSAALDRESLTVGDEIGVFTEAGVCAGAVAVPRAGFPLGLSAWNWDYVSHQDYNEDIDYFQRDDPIHFRFWNHIEEREYEAEISEVLEGVARFDPEGFAALRLEAYRYGDQPVALVAREDIDFGEVKQFRSGDIALSVRNGGRQPLRIIEAVCQGEYFSVDFPEEVVLQLGETFDMPLCFAPEEEGDFECLLTLITNDPNEGEIEIWLRGRGIPPNPPTISLSDWQVNFGGVPLEQSRNFRLTIQNLGDEELVIDNIAAGSEEFLTSFEAPVHLRAEEVYDLTITFMPPLAQHYETGLVIESNDPGQGRIEIWMGGSGVGPQISVQPDFLNFGEAVLGTSRELSFSLSNQGPLPLIIEPDEIESEAFTTNLRDFIVSERHFQFRASDVCHSILVRSALIDGEPLSYRDEIAVLTPADYCAGAIVVQNPGAMIGLSAWQADDLAEIFGFEDGQPFTFAFWDVSTQQVITAVADFIEGPESFTPDGFSVVNLTSTDEREEFDWPPLVLQPGRAIQVGCVFTPTELGECDYQWILRSNDQSHPNCAVSFHGVGIPSLQAAPDNVDFGNVFASGFSFQTIQVLNHNPFPVTITGVEVDNESFWAFPAPDARHPYFYCLPQAEDHSLLIREAFIDEAFLAAGDEIAAFTPEGVCAGSVRVVNPGQPLGFAVWADNEITEAVDGFQDGEALTFRFWQAATGQVMETEVDFLEGSHLFQVNSFTALDLRAGDSRYQGDFPSLTIPPESAAALNVIFNPQQIGFQEGNLAIHTDFELQPDIEVWLSGRGVLAPDIELSDSRHDFGMVQLDNTVEWPLLVTNVGEAALVVNSLALSGAGFSLNRDAGFNLDVDQTQRVRISFSPTESRSYQGRLFIFSNDPDEPTRMVTLCGQVGRSLTVSMTGGWNMMSINVSPPLEFYREGEERGPDVRLMTDQLREGDNHHLIIMKDDWGRFYAPAWDFSNIPYWDLTRGYQMMVNQDIQAVWDGNPIPADADVPLVNGWNIIAYYPTYTLDASAPDFYVLSPIIEHVNIAKDENGNFMSPPWEFSNMQPWREGKGYQVCVDQAVTLNYPPQEGNLAEIEKCLANEPVSPKSNCNMSVLLDRISGLTDCQGFVLAWNGDGACVGEGQVDEDGRCGLAVWGDDPVSAGREGLLEGEAFTLVMVDEASGKWVPVDVLSILAGDGLTYETDGFTVVEVALRQSLPTEYCLEKPYPNPFNESVLVQYAIPEASHVKLTVYDLSGRLVAVLDNQEREIGRYRMVWNSDGAAAGLYILHLKVGSIVKIQKLALVR